ncbi:PHD-zinc-finger like domain-containing protein [Sphaerosporella brunnea]|uniref:PHD-zinc-finger like domain-containing protein n=1 Tax=Sphaerosporella brunnea TaxID=1250544 RepID=A0A5J5EK80_9PEZI|nr:PHD-zinc-finger like domain-containing protein [Sphaerosporella brunnea]
MPSASQARYGKKRKNVASQMIIPMTKDASLSNMLSSENPFLQDGKLVADDGTTLAVHVPTRRGRLAMMKMMICRPAGVGTETPREAMEIKYPDPTPEQLAFAQMCNEYYECVLCPEHEDPDAEPEKNNPYHKSSYKKKAAQDKLNKESPEVDGRKVKDTDKNKPQPREPLKKTQNNNWAHVICAVWTPEIKFSDPRTMKVIEGIGTIPKDRFQNECKVCKVNNGATVECTICRANVHINCAHKSGWRMGFDIQPVKGSRRDTVNIVKLGNETGLMTACLWCPEHEVKSTIHRVNEISEETGLTALELYLQTYKQADLALTSTVRKATNLSINGKTNHVNRRNSLVGASAKEGTDSPTTVFIKSEGVEMIGGLEGLLPDHVGGDGPKCCMHCLVDVSPLWWKAPLPSPTTNGAGSSAAPLTNGHAPKTTTLGLLCSRCHKDKEQPAIPFAASKANGVRTPDPKHTPLPPLHVFLAQQHQHQAMQRQQQIQQQALPPHPPPPPPGLPPRAVPPPQQSGIPPQLPSPQRPPLGSIPHPPIPPHGMVHQMPQPPPVHATPHHVPPPPYQPASAPPLHMSPRPPLSQHNPNLHHNSPPRHIAAPHRQLHMPPQPPHLSPPHIMSQRHPSHTSPPPPPHMMPVHAPPPLALHRQNPHPMQPQQVLHAPIPPPPQPVVQQVQQQEEHQRRVMSGASGSPALANLLS